MQRTWADDERELLQANYSQEDIALEKQRQYNELVDGGFDQKDIDSYFGTKQPNMTPVQQMLENNYQKYVVNADEDVKDFFDFFDRVVMGKKPQGAEEDKVSMSDAFKEGMKESVPVMQYKAAHGESVINHEQLPPEYFDSFDRAAKMAGTIAGDLPYMVAGAAYGGVAGGAAGLAGGFAIAGPAGAAAGLMAGTVIGAGAGANALPAALRSHLVNFYEKGEVTSFGDFWERLTAVMVDTGKEAVYGGVSEYVGGKVGAKVVQKGGGYLLQRTSQAGSELATMVGMKAAIENEAPSLQDFQDATVLITGLTGSTYTAGKLFKIYKMTGVHPASVAEEAKKNPALMEKLKAANDDLPPEYQSMVTPIQESIDMASNVLTKNALEATGQKVPDNMVELTPAEMASKKIRESIGVEEKSDIKQFYEDIKKVKSAEEAYSFGKKIMSGPIANAAREYYSNVMNRYFPIRQVSEKAFERYKLLSGTSGLVRTFVEDHTFDFDTKQRNGESLARIIDDVDDVIGFENYLVARRVVELRNRNITQISNLTTDEANALIKRDASKYEKQAQRFYDFEDRVMDYVKKSGRFSDEDIAVMKQMNRSHISLKKVIDPTDASKGRKTKDPYKRIGSSDLQIRNPLLSTYENVDAAIKLAQINKAKLDFVVDAESKDLVEKVAQPKKMIKISEEEVKKFFEDHGIDADPESFSVFRSAKSFLKENEIEVYNNGKLEVYEIKDKVLAQAVKSFEEDPYMQGIGFMAARAVATAFKFGTTGIPDFIAQNVVVDYITSIVKSTDLGELRKNMSPQLFVDAYKYNVAALSSLVKKDAGFYEYLKSGAFGSGWTDAETALLKITEGRYNTKEFDEIHSKTRNVVRTAKDYYEAAQLISEHFVRIKKYQEMKRKGATDNKAGIAAKDETLDFSQRGYNRALANMSAITAFQNVAIQGVDNFARTVGKDPKKVVMNGTAVLTTAAVALWLVNKEDERIDERPEWEKLTYFHIATDDWQNVSNEYEMAEANALMNLERHSNQVRTLPDGTIQINRGIILKLRKPPVYGEIFATLPTMLLDKFFADKPQQLDEFSKSFFQNALPTVVPNIAIPMVEQFANKSFFTGNAIIPFTMEKTSPELQYTEYTNPSARALGKMIEGIPVIGNAAKNMNLSSPVVLENYIRQWTGGGGMYLLQIASKVTPQEAYQKYDINKELKKPASSIADIPFVKRFVSRNPSSGMKSITDFQKYYEKYSQLEADANIERSRWNMENFSAIKQMQLETFAPIKGIAEAIRNQTAIIHITYKRPDLNETEKRQLIDATYYQMLGLSQQGLELIRQFEEDNKQFNSEGIEK